MTFKRRLNPPWAFNNPESANNSIGSRLRKHLPAEVGLKIRVEDSAYYLTEAMYDFLSAYKTVEEIMEDRDQWGITLSRYIQSFIDSLAALAKSLGVSPGDDEFLNKVLKGEFAWTIPIAKLTGLSMPLQSGHELLRLLRVLPKIADMKPSWYAQQE